MLALSKAVLKVCSSTMPIVRSPGHDVIVIKTGLCKPQTYVLEFFKSKNCERPPWKREEAF